MRWNLQWSKFVLTVSLEWNLCSSRSQSWVQGVTGLCISERGSLRWTFLFYPLNPKKMKFMPWVPKNSLSKNIILLEFSKILPMKIQKHKYINSQVKEFCLSFIWQHPQFQPFVPFETSPMLLLFCFVFLQVQLFVDLGQNKQANKNKHVF